MGLVETLKKGLRRKKRKDMPDAGASDPASTAPLNKVATIPAHSKAREKFGLFPLHSPGGEQGEITVDIVAVHGLEGDWEATWTDSSSGKLWLRDFIPSGFASDPDGSGLRVWSFGYDSATALSKSVADIDGAAIALIDALHGERQHESSKRKPIIFIAHSLGGIIVKRAMALAIERSDYWKDLVDSVFGIMFFAVPHRGADLAFWAAMASRIGSLATLGLAGNSKFVEALQRNSLTFKQISDSFVQPASRLKIIRTFYETVKIGNQLIVDTDSATLGVTNERAIPIQGANHRDICKFSSDQTQKYRAVRNAMKEMVDSIHDRELMLSFDPLNMSTKPGWEDESPEQHKIGLAIPRQLPLKDRSSQISGAVDELLAALAFPEMIIMPSLQVPSDSHGWLHQDKAFCDWLQLHQDSTNKGLLWIRGNLGSGKTTAITDCFHRLSAVSLTESKQNHHTAVFFFNGTRTAVHPQRSLVGMYRTLLYQLLRSRPDAEIREIFLRFDLESQFREDATLSSVTEPQWQAIFSSVLQTLSNSSSRITIFIDAVDACSAHNAATELDRYFRKVSMESRGLKVCLSTRPFGSWDIAQGPTIVVENATSPAIRSYIDEKLEICTRDDRKQFKSISHKIEAKSGGNFLWAQLSVTLLLNKLGQGIRNAQYLETQLAILPDTLRSLYKTVLQDQVRDSGHQQIALRFFQWAIFAPDLSLRGWRDLLPFLGGQAAPLSLKTSHTSEYWAIGKKGLWMDNLEQLICRVSLGLARIAPSARLSNSDDAAEWISLAGNAGSLDFTAGDMRVVQPIHESVRQLFLDGDGFAILNPKSRQNHTHEGLISLMHSCLDFINVPELDKFIEARHQSKEARLDLLDFNNGAEPSEFNAERHGSDEVRKSHYPRQFDGSSDGFESAGNSVRTFTSASSLQHGKNRPRDRASVADSTEYSKISGTGDSDSSDLKEGVDNHDELGSRLKLIPQISSHNRVGDWMEETSLACLSPGGDQSAVVGAISRSGDFYDTSRQEDFDTLVSEFSASTYGRSNNASVAASRKRDRVQHPEFLQYALSVFPQLAQKAEILKIDTATVIERLRESVLLHRYLCLSEESTTAITLQQWAESHELLTWVSYLSRTRKNFYMDQSHSRHRINSTDLALSYCFDYGDAFFRKRPDASWPLLTRDPDVSDSHDFKNSFKDARLLDDSDSSKREAEMYSLTDALWAKLSYVRKPAPDWWERSFITYRCLQTVLTPRQAQTVLKSGGIDEKEAEFISTSCLRIVGASLLVSWSFERPELQVARFVKAIVAAQIDDTCLPLTKDALRTAVMDKRLSRDRVTTDFLQYQDYFLSPYFARPFGIIHHYMMATSRIVFPAIEFEAVFQRHLRKTRKGRNVDRRVSAWKVKLHPHSFDFGEYEFKTKNDSSFVLMCMENFSWIEFLAHVYAWLHVKHRLGDACGIHPLLCTFQQPKSSPRYASDETRVKEGQEIHPSYYFIYSCAQGTMEDFLKRPQKPWALAGKISEKWLIEQCQRMTASSGAVHDVARLTMPNLPRLNFLEHVGLTARNFSWFSPSEDDAGELVLSHMMVSEPSDRMDLPPEADQRHQRDGQKKLSARKIHVWCLAVIWLDLVTWYLLGPAGIHKFATKRMGSEGRYYDKVDLHGGVGGYEVTNAVLEWMKSLEQHAVGMPGIKDILALVRLRMLVVDAHKRAPGHEVTQILKRLKDSS